VAPLVAALSLASACADAPPPPAPPQPVAIAPVPAPRVAPAPPSTEADALVAAMLERVSRIRGLPIKHPVKGRTLSRGDMIAKLKSKMDRELPADTIAAEGELLAGLGLVPPRYDFLKGSLALLEGQIAGFYEPADETMYLVDDLDEAEANETLAHELVHALQDQAFHIQRFLDFKPGTSDRVDAAHAVIEGDATSAMIDATTGPGGALQVSPAMLRASLLVGLRLTPSGAETPQVIAASLMAPYGDGFAFVDGQRRAGGWPAVDAAIGAMPATTEQLLHPKKYAAHEPALDVPDVPIDALGAGFSRQLDDDMGEQGLRILLATWAPEAAEVAASGWGGDKLVVARKVDGPRRTFAVAYHVRYDTPKDADAVAKLLGAKRKPCEARAEMGSLAWHRKGADVALVGGPYTREGDVIKPAGTCADATRWARAIVGD
jgi:hypothetical protein